MDYRERHGYTRTIGKVTLLSGKKLNCQVYFNEDAGSSKNDACVFGESTSETAKIIKKAIGPSGPNIDYLKNLANGIKKLNMGTDEYLEELLQKVEGGKKK